MSLLRQGVIKTTETETQYCCWVNTYAIILLGFESVTFVWIYFCHESFHLYSCSLSVLKWDKAKHNGLSSIDGSSVSITEQNAGQINSYQMEAAIQSDKRFAKRVNNTRLMFLSANLSLSFVQEWGNLNIMNCTALMKAMFQLSFKTLHK